MHNDPLANYISLLNNYKQAIKADKNVNEIYKWESVYQFNHIFNIQATDFERNLRDALKKVGNLIYVNSIGYLLRAAKHFPEEVRKMFKVLYHEEEDLQTRINQFQKMAEELLPAVIEKHGSNLNHQQDERTISLYLAMRYPDRYPIFKNEIYKVLLDVFPGEVPQKAGKKYLHYISLSKQVIPLIESDKELLELSRSTLTPQAYSGNPLQLIFQDILWRNRPVKNEIEQLNYYVVGASWDKEDQSQRFLQNGIWQNGYDGKFLDETNAIEVGSRIAIKAVHTVEVTKSVMTIKAIGTVTANHNDGRMLEVDWDKNFKPFKVDFSGGYWQTVHPVTNPDHIKAIFFHQPLSTQQAKQSPKDIFMPSLNTILYGPPGTGKTYHSIDKAVEIVLGKSLGKHEDNKAEFDRLRKEGQIEFVTFHQNYTYEDFMVGLTPDITSGTLKFERKEGVFKKISDRAKTNWLASQSPDESIISFEHVFNSFFSALIEEEVEEIRIPMKSRGYEFKVTKIEPEEGRIKFTKKSGGTGHDLLVKNLKGIYEGTIDYAQEGLGVYYYPLIEKLQEHANTQATSETVGTSLKNYVLIIDEINRANISKVFGELITLLEDDKRLGAENELKISLPNGDKEFGVPPNLYVVGTMNTADRSIALVDIALRRRFEFLGQYPDYAMLNKEEATLLRQVNEAVYNEKRSADYLVGHAYFMKGQSVKTVLRTKVIPLLIEYFSGKTETVSKIFDSTNWSVVFDKDSYSWNINSKSS